MECVGEDDCGGDVVVAECLRAGGSVVGAESEQGVAKVCAEGAFDLSATQSASSRSNPASSSAMGLAPLFVTRRTRS